MHIVYYLLPMESANELIETGPITLSHCRKYCNRVSVDFIVDFLSHCLPLREEEIFECATMGIIFLQVTIILTQ